MARHYGFTCDRCGQSIKQPGEHTMITVAKQLPKDKAQFDLCEICVAVLFSDFKVIGRPYELDFPKSV
jgi:hypothetical protein